jgi:hypothetical protein
MELNDSSRIFLLKKFNEDRHFQKGRKIKNDQLKVSIGE